MGTIIVSLILLGIVGGIIAKMIQNKKSGKSSCGCPGCSGCSGLKTSGTCGKKY